MEKDSFYCSLLEQRYDNLRYCLEGQLHHVTDMILECDNRNCANVAVEYTQEFDEGSTDWFKCEQCWTMFCKECAVKVKLHTNNPSQCLKVERLKTEVEEGEAEIAEKKRTIEIFESRKTK